MNTEQQQQRIMGYFIEEAKDHLNTIEQGVLNLQDVLLDREMTNEMFRAAHSIKGGAAMLGVASVQHISHRLEDYFKILQEHSNIQVDERLKSLFLAGFDRLQELVEQLEVNYKISDELAAAALESVKPIFIELESYLNSLVDGTGIDSSGNALDRIFQVEVSNKLRDMLQLFKLEESSSSRRELDSICSELLTIGNNLNLDKWSELIFTVKAAIAFQDNSYRTLAPVIIKDTKHAQNLVLEGRDWEINISPELQALIPTSAPIASFDDDMTVFMDNISDFDSSDISMDDLFSDAGLEYDSVSTSEFDDLSDLFESAIAPKDAEEPTDLDLESLFESTQEETNSTTDAGFDDFGLEDLLQESISTPDTQEVEISSIQDDDLGLEDFFSATDEDNFEPIQSIDAGTWSADAVETSETGLDEFFDEFANEFSMVTEVTEITDDIALNDISEFSAAQDENIVDENQIDFADLLIGENSQEEDRILDFNEFSSTEDAEIDSEEFSVEFSGVSIEEPVSTEDIVDFNEFSDPEDAEMDSDEFSIEFSGVSIEEPVSTQVNIDDFVSVDELHELDTIIDAPIAIEEPKAISSFDELETLIETTPLVQVKKAPSDDFDDLEALLRDSNDVGGASTKVAKRSMPAKRQASKIISQTMKVEVKHLDSLNNLVGELVVNRNLLDQNQEKMQQFLSNLLNQVQLLSDESQKMRDQYDRSLLENSLVATREQSRVSTALMQGRGDDDQITRSTSSDFDSIELDRFSDFHTLSQEIIELIVRVRESASDIEFVIGENDQVTRQLGVITNQVQDDLKQSRMVPFAQIADRLPRAVRDLAIKTGKEADIDIKGRETLIDKAILEQLYDPMTHLVSNAIVHGLENPNTRKGSGKQAKGLITVRAYHQGNQTIISVSDDGAGIDVEKVKQSAVNKGIRTQEEVDQLSDDQVYELLFEAGFSTKSQADELSGRGVGLDVVSTALNDIRGVVITESSLLKGTTFTIRLPLTLSISKAMECVSNRTKIAFPVDGFEDMIEVPLSQVFTNEKGQSCLEWRNTTLPFQLLSDLLPYTRQVSRKSIYNKQEDDVISIIVLRNDTGYLALQIDQFIGENEIVIKQLEGPIPKPLGIAGATILGDGRVMAIANVLELFDIASGRLKSGHSVPELPINEPDETTDPTVLIVDDSITVRELLSLTFSKVGYKVEQAKDGKDAWEKLRAGMVCDLIFCDIEMPKMNGLELLGRLQKDEVLSKIPVAMLTSRGGDIHRNNAKELGAKAYFTKPYLEEEVITGSKRLLQGELLPY